MKKPINIRIDSELWEWVQLRAKIHERSATSVVEEALGDWVGVKGAHPASAAPVKRYVVTNPPTDGEIVVLDDACPYTAKQLQGKTRLPLAACQRAIDKGTWRELL